MNRLFDISIKHLNADFDFHVYFPASLDNPRNNAVMFVNEKNAHRINLLCSVENSVIFYPQTHTIPESIAEKNLTIGCSDPRTEYSLFFKTNSITNLPKAEEVKTVNGALIAKGAQIGHNVTIMPLAYVGSEVTIGDGSYIGIGTRLVGRVILGKNVIIRENSVIGADGLSTDRDVNGKAATMPQFGGVQIGDDVQIGALTVIARGAIDDTIICEGSKIDNSSFISHNVHIGNDTFIVGETIMFGGSSTGEQAFISGNSTIRNKVAIGNKALVGMGSVVTKNVADGQTVLGNPAHSK